MSSKKTRRVSAARTRRTGTMRSQTGHTAAKPGGAHKRALWIGGLALGAAAAVGAMLYFSKPASAATLTQLPPGPTPGPGPAPSGSGTPSGDQNVTGVDTTGGDGGDASMTSGQTNQ